MMANAGRAKRSSRLDEQTAFEWASAPKGAFEISEERDAIRSEMGRAKRAGLAMVLIFALAGLAGAGLVALSGSGLSGPWETRLAWALGYSLALGFALRGQGGSGWAGVAAGGAALIWIGAAQAASHGGLLWAQPGGIGAAKIAIAHAGALGFAWIFADLYGIWVGSRMARSARKLRETEFCGEMERLEMIRLEGLSRRVDRYWGEIQAKHRAPTRREFVELRREALSALKGGREEGKAEPIKAMRVGGRAPAAEASAA